MPHCILHYSANVVDDVDFHAAFEALHDALAAAGPFDRGNIKSRAIRCSDFRVGDGAEDRTFVSMEIAIFEGRDEATKARITSAALDVLKAAFPVTMARTRCDLTVRISEMDRGSYAKYCSAGPE
jgi:5-carboxymethyl-2-hydroxymuconate isomerase